MDVVWIVLVMVLVLGYLFGLVLFGLLLICFVGVGDLCSIGFGNIGVMNVLCIGCKGLVVVMLLFDGGKGVVVVLIV